MNQPQISPVHDDLLFHGPLSEGRAQRLIRSLGPLANRHVVDLGCGWAELLLRAVATDPAASGHGIDTDAAAVEHGRRNAVARGLADRVALDVADAGAWSGTADVLVVIGASHVWGGDPTEHTSNALRAGRDRLPKGGRLLLGEGFWQHDPTEERLEAMATPREQYRTLPDLVDFAAAHGYRLLHLSRASDDEWDEFESGHALGWERWLWEHPDSPHAEQIAARADAHRRAWLRGWQGVMGFAYLTLIVH